MRLRVPGVEIDGLAIKRFGLRQAILPREGDSQIVVGFGVTGLELDRRRIAPGGFSVAAEALENLSQIVAANCRVGAQSNRPLNQRESGLELAGLQCEHAE